MRAAPREAWGIFDGDGRNLPSHSGGHRLAVDVHRQQLAQRLDSVEHAVRRCPTDRHTFRGHLEGVTLFAQRRGERLVDPERDEPRRGRPTAPDGEIEPCRRVQEIGELPSLCLERRVGDDGGGGREDELAAPRCDPGRERDHRDRAGCRRCLSGHRSGQRHKSECDAHGTFYHEARVPTK